MKITNIRGALRAVERAGGVLRAAERVGYAVGVGLLILGTAGTAHAHRASALHAVPARAVVDPGGGALHARLLAFGDPDDGGQLHRN